MAPDVPLFSLMKSKEIFYLLIRKKERKKEGYGLWIPKLTDIFVLLLAFFIFFSLFVFVLVLVI